jgi:hypothetical protein
MNRPMHSMLRRGVRALAALLLAVPALGQDEPPPWTYVTELESEKQIFQWVAAVLFIVGCVAIAFKNPHRSHLD